MNIAIVSHMFPTPNDSVGGIFVLQQVRALSEQGHEVVVISPTPCVPEVASELLDRPSSTNIPKTDTYGDITVHYPRYWSLPRPETLPIVAYSFRRTLNQHSGLFKSADVINAHVALPDGFGCIPLARSLDIPLVTTIHGADLQHTIHRPIPKRQIRTVFQASDRIVLNSKKLQRVYSKHFSDVKKTDVVFNGFSTESAHDAKPIEEIGSGLRIVSVGSLVKEKGHRHALEAMANLSFDFKYVIVGDGPLRTTLEETSSNLGIQDQVSFVGEVEHDTVFSYLKSSDIFVLPSYEEAFGIAYLEAMACGLPVIACEGEGPADFITHRETGFLVPPKDPDAIVDVIRELQADHELREHVADRGQRTALNRFSWERNAKAVERIFYEAIEAHK
ncbi:glycosyltransferase family 4 protein [Halorubrum distributum]|uniref:Group 1 glycosyl transferase n=1 Tax=Halorubrum distributum JCM 10247 TaxID=1227486 RepID=M0DNX9_9EURY|nr:glycosyltransferase family 4 protein [Halorubrum terrestre]ELZ37185.1 group 1 glycosyl transferase [Halorubrum terrestre JCM 10247]